MFTGRGHDWMFSEKEKWDEWMNDPVEKQTLRKLQSFQIVS